MDSATEELRRRLDEILDREQAALRERHGFESRRMNEFLARRHAESQRPLRRDRALPRPSLRGRGGRRGLPRAARGARAAARARGLPEARGQPLPRPEPADYETAQQIRERLEALEQLARDLAEGNFEAISPEQLRELLGGAGARRSILILRDLESDAAARRLPARTRGPELTPRAIRRIGAQALAEVYGALRKDRPGGHEIDARGAALPRPDETRPFEFGDPLDLDVVRTLLNAVKRGARAAPGRRGAPLAARRGLRALERDYETHTTTVLLLDMSWSMSWAGRFPAAKRVALALDHLIRTRFPRDHFFVVGFSTRARELAIPRAARAELGHGRPVHQPPGGADARRAADREASEREPAGARDHRRPADRVLRPGRLRVEWPMGFGGVSPHAVAETMKQVRRITRRGVTINTFMLDDAPELVGFVERMTAGEPRARLLHEPRASSARS